MSENEERLQDEMIVLTDERLADKGFVLGVFWSLMDGVVLAEKCEKCGTDMYLSQIRRTYTPEELKDVELKLNHTCPKCNHIKRQGILIGPTLVELEADKEQAKAEDEPDA